MDAFECIPSSCIQKSFNAPWMHHSGNQLFFNGPTPLVDPKSRRLVFSIHLPASLVVCNAFSFFPCNHQRAVPTIEFFKTCRKWW